MNVMGERTRLLFVRFIYVHPQHAAVLCVLTFAIIMPGDVSRVALLRIQGTLQAGEFRGASVPILVPSSIEPVDPPDNPYLYS